MSWLPGGETNRVPVRSRRRQPQVIAAYLRSCQTVHPFDWQEACPVGRPALSRRGPDPHPAVRLPPCRELIQARLQAGHAARTSSVTACGCLGIAAPSRM